MIWGHLETVGYELGHLETQNRWRELWNRWGAWSNFLCVAFVLHHVDDDERQFWGQSRTASPS